MAIAPKGVKQTPVPASTQKTMVVLEEATLATMAINPKLLAEFPMLAPIANMLRTQGVSCGSCGAAAKNRAAVYAKVKLAIVALTPDKKKRLKEMLNTRQVRIVYKDTADRPQQLTF